MECSLRYMQITISLIKSYSKLLWELTLKRKSALNLLVRLVLLKHQYLKKKV